MPYKTISNNEGTHVMLDGVEIAIKPDRASALEFIAGQAARRAEAAEARAAQLETDNDEMQSYINEIRVALHTEKDELTIDAVRRVISERDTAWSELREIRKAINADENEATSDEVRRVVAELARKLEQAQRVCAYWLEDGRFLVANSPAHKAAVDMLREVSNYAA